MIDMGKHKILPSTFAKHFCQHFPLVLTLPKKKQGIQHTIAYVVDIT